MPFKAEAGMKAVSVVGFPYVVERLIWAPLANRVR